MTSDSTGPRRLRVRHVAATGTALAGVLLPLAAGVLLARSVGADPMTSVNAFLTGGAQRAAVRTPRLPGCRRHAVLGRAPVVRSAATLREAAGRIRPVADRCAVALAPLGRRARRPATAGAGPAAAPAGGGLR
ncbi:hypothetical protein [Streptomyces sp. NPDC005805]|uniref:hypothetical protein n=1 Tax=Streptomyces sp. NPDC005805 TaxID=3157068 RepID=UPI00340CD19B